MPKVYHSIEEIKMAFFLPNILDRLGVSLCSFLNLSDDNYSISKSKDNPNTGFVAVRKPMHCLYFPEESFKRIEEKIKMFYQREGFEIEREIFTGVKKDKEHYNIFLFETEDYYSVQIWNKSSVI